MPGNIQAVERAAALLTLVASASRPLGLADIAAAVDLPKSTVHGLLATLRSIGWIEQDRPSGTYRVARTLAGLAQPLDSADLRSAATPWMDALAAQTGLEVHLTWLEGARATVVHTRSPGVRNAPMMMIRTTAWRRYFVRNCGVTKFSAASARTASAPIGSPPCSASCRATAAPRSSWSARPATEATRFCSTTAN